MKHLTPKIVFTGGGTAGHVIPNLVLFENLEPKGWSCHYIGSFAGIEKNLVGSSMPYHGISSGKLRRYLDFQNFTDIFRVLLGIFQSFFLLGKIKPQIIFSKGGFVSVPVVLSGWLRGIPVIIHEADITPGLANRITLPFAKKICVAFKETIKHLPPRKCIHTGIPIRPDLLKGDRDKGFQISKFNSEKPVLLVTGGSLGASSLNLTLRNSLEELTQHFQVIHLCGKGKLDPSLNSKKAYLQFEYVDKELPHLFAIADIVLSRAGANTLFELLALKKPHLLVPLSLKASRGDQILNAKSFRYQKFSRVLQEEDLTPSSLIQELNRLYTKRDYYQSNMSESSVLDSTQIICEALEKVIGKKV